LFAVTHAFIASPVGMLLLFGWSIAFFYHLATESGTSPGMPATASSCGKPIAAATRSLPSPRWLTVLTWLYVFLT